MSVGESGPHRELARVAAGVGPAADAARVALGEGPVESRLRAAILALARRRGPDSSICPSDAARAIGGQQWRELTDDSRSAAFALARDGDVQITQRGDILDPDRPSRGPIRIRVSPA